MELSNNRLTGSIPCKLARVLSLIFLSVRNNQLLGQIPVEFSNLHNLCKLVSIIFNNYFELNQNYKIPLTFQKTILMERIHILKL